jgi:hypothetical protein
MHTMRHTSFTSYFNKATATGSQDVGMLCTTKVDPPWMGTK